MRTANIFAFPSLCILIILLHPTPQISAVDYPINVWPKPTTFTWPNPQSTLLSPNLSIFYTDGQYTNYLAAAVKRYELRFSDEKHQFLVEPTLNLTSSPPLQALNINILDASIPLVHGVDESYSLNIPSGYASNAANLTANTVWGAMRGLETFSQLIYGDPLKIACDLYIEDKPLYVYRGVMLDTSRNYYGVEDLKRLITAMSMNKLNAFHWHIIDSQSFPLELESEPELAEKGAYGKDMRYSVQNVKDIVQFGMERGVRVIPELDMPTHAASWGEAYPEIVTCTDKFWWPAGTDWEDRYAVQPTPGQLNPLIPKTYEVVKNVIHDVVSMFPDTFYHAGADEIIPNCWKADPTIQDFLNKNGTLTQALEMFVNGTLPSILAQNRTVVYWEDIMLAETFNVSSSVLPKENVILQTWNNGPNNTKKIVSAGYRVIVSSADYYYLDCGHGGFLGNDSQYDQPPTNPPGKGGSWCNPFKTWQTIYDYDIAYGLTEEEAKLVIGGEVALWSEQSDGTVMDSRIWPRASALAESLWSGNRDENGKKRYAEATDRLNEWRYRMTKRWIGAEPIQPLWCVKHPGMCNAA